MRYRHSLSVTWRERLRHLRFFIKHLPDRVSLFSFHKAERLLAWLYGPDCLGIDFSEEHSLRRVLRMFCETAAICNGSQRYILERRYVMGGYYVRIVKAGRQTFKPTDNDR